jgi:hypothetical protein
MLSWTAATAADLLVALLAAVLGIHFLLASHRLGGLTVLRLPGLGFLALAASAPLFAPTLAGDGYTQWDALRVLLQFVGFSAIGLGYLLLSRHGDVPEPGFGFAYQVLLIALVVALAPFAVIAVLHPILRSADELAYAFTAALAAAVAVQLLRQRGPGSHRTVVALGFGFLAAGQTVLAYVALEVSPVPQFAAGLADAFLLAGLLAFVATLWLERSERAPALSEA